MTPIRPLLALLACTALASPADALTVGQRIELFGRKVIHAASETISLYIQANSPISFTWYVWRVGFHTTGATAQ